jgi:heptosyltransferase-2
MKILVFRLSSLGDVILATAFLENLPEGTQVDWVIAKEFEFVLKGHPQIRRLIPFDKKTGLLGWFKLVRSFSQESYEFRVDLHRTLRTRLAFLLFVFFGTGKRIVVSKERVKTMALLILKQWTPSWLIPTPYWLRFARLSQGVSSSPTELKTPSFLSIVAQSGFRDSEVLLQYQLEKDQYFCVMPASRWMTKEWGSNRFFEVVKLLQGRGWIPVVLGREKDRSCVELRTRLTQSGLVFRDALNEVDFKKTAILLKNARFYLGCDTGLSHLAESVGCPAFVVFGPTQPELGFGPARSKSRSVTAHVLCSPCSKDGRVCYRVDDPYICMKQIQPEQVALEINQCDF